MSICFFLSLKCVTKWCQMIVSTMVTGIANDHDPLQHMPSLPEQNLGVYLSIEFPMRYLKNEHPQPERKKDEMGEAQRMSHMSSHVLRTLPKADIALEKWHFARLAWYFWVDVVIFRFHVTVLVMQRFWLWPVRTFLNSKRRPSWLAALSVC